MSLSIIIRKKDTFKSPIKLSVQKVNKYAWRRYVHRRKRSFSQRLKRAIKSIFVRKHVYRTQNQIAMF